MRALRMDGRTALTEAVRFGGLPIRARFSLLAFRLFHSWASVLRSHWVSQAALAPENAQRGTSSRVWYRRTGRSSTDETDHLAEI